MRQVFADTFYWIALVNPRDDWYVQVLSVSNSLGKVQIVTTDEVLIEVLTFYAESGSYQRQRIVNFVDSILKSSQTVVIQQTHESFLTGFSLYRQRLDKGYSLTDCISMQTMRQLGMTEVLTHDRHFTQEGFVILLTD
jgi:predicted nucleic acid-binding protein